jgi:hypothetical protein
MGDGYSGCCDCWDCWGVCRAPGLPKLCAGPPACRSAGCDLARAAAAALNASSSSAEAHSKCPQPCGQSAHPQKHLQAQEPKAFEQ